MSAVAINDEQIRLRTAVSKLTDPDQNSDLHHEKKPMPRSHDEPELLGMDRYAELLIRSQERSDERFTRLIEVMGNKKTNWPAWLAAGVAALALLFSISGSKWTDANQSDLKKDIAVLTEKLTNFELRQNEFRRDTERNYLLMDERYRQLSIALEARGIRLPTK